MERKVKPTEKRKHKENLSDLKQLIQQDAPDAPVKDVAWEASQASAESSTHLEDDAGYGEPIVIRMFEFAVNPEAFKAHKPTAQELFNTHLRGIEVMLWKDGLQILPEVEPRMQMGKKKYRIFVGAKASRGNILPWQVKPQTLTEVAHG